MTNFDILARSKFIKELSEEGFNSGEIAEILFALEMPNIYEAVTGERLERKE